LQLLLEKIVRIIFSPQSAGIFSANLLIIVKKQGMKFLNFLLSRPRLYRMAGKTARFMLKFTPNFILNNRFNSWGKQRELPAVPEESFREWWLKNKK
jgi:L-lactate dehydrogenase complex protein LldF